MLVHGLATNMAFWFPQLLPALARDYQVTAYDLRGHGRSGMPASGYGIEDMVSDLNALLQHQGVNRVHLIGHSYGGDVALNYAVAHPDRVISLTIADTRVGAFQQNSQLAEWLAAGTEELHLERVNDGVSADQGAGDRANGGLATALAAVGPAGAGPSGPFPLSVYSSISDRTAQQWATLLRTTSALADLLAPPRLGLADLAEVRAPALAIFGEHSDFLPSCHGLQRHLPDCQTVLVPGAGHFHPRRRADFFLCETRAFLDRLNGATGGAT
jgi:pimeloyl-ACP methyl ester carboxylesterase